MYAKIFEQILDSSIAENPLVRFTFMDMLVLADADGVVDMTHEAIARRTNRPIEEIRSTISQLEQPDPKSRSSEEDGRRILRMDDHRDWGWQIVNYQKFREIGTELQKREVTRQRVRRYRKNVQKVQQNGQCNAGVTLCNASYASASASASPSASVSVSALERGKGKTFPLTEAEAVEAVGNGVPADFTRQKFNSLLGVGFVTSDGRPINCFKSYVTGAWLSEMNKPKPPTKNSQAEREAERIASGR